MKSIETISWEDETGNVILIDQTRLPGSYRLVRCRTTDRLVRAIRTLEVRGAPALGIAGAYGVLLAIKQIRERDHSLFLRRLYREAEKIRSARPTAVNLSLGVRVVMEAVESAGSVKEAKENAHGAAKAFADAESRSCHEIGTRGAALIPEKCTVLTHCNAGALACREWGTALGVIRRPARSSRAPA